MIDITLNEDVKEQILEDAIMRFPEEACGVLINNFSEYYPCDNIADNPEEEFKISEKDLLNAYESGEVDAWVHSHTNGNTELTEADKYYQNQTDCIWILCVLDSSGNFSCFREYDIGD